MIIIGYNSEKTDISYEKYSDLVIFCRADLRHFQPVISIMKITFTEPINIFKVSERFSACGTQTEKLFCCALTFIWKTTTITKPPATNYRNNATNNAIWRTFIYGIQWPNNHFELFQILSGVNNDRNFVFLQLENYLKIIFIKFAHKISSYCHTIRSIWCSFFSPFEQTFCLNHIQSIPC